MQCTWKDCDNEASETRVSDSGETWASLCYIHNAKLDAAIRGGEPKNLIGCYIKAQGGAEKVVARETIRKDMKVIAETIERFIKQWR
jgi:hypothetical protein